MKKMFLEKNINPVTNSIVTGLTICISVIFLSFFICGCGKPSYPKEKLIAKIKKVVKDEYGYDIRAKIVGKTFGIYFPITQILNHDNTMKANFEDKQQQIFLSAVRACLSTDADIDFFVIKFTEKLKGFEINIIKSVEDTKRLLLGNISRNDYFHRTVQKISIDTNNFTQNFIRKFFQNIRDNKSSLSAYFLPGEKFNNSFWFRHLMEVELKENIHYEIIKVSSKQIGKNIFLVYAKVKEEYTPKAGYENYGFMFPSGQIHRFLFEINLISLIPVIVDNYSFKDKENGKIITPPVPEVFAEHMDIRSWDDYFYLDEINQPEFIIGQVSTKLNRKLSEAVNPETERQPDDIEFLSEPQPISSIDGIYIDKGDSKTKDKTFQLIFYFSPTAAEKTISDELFDMTITFFKRTLKKYHYKDYNELVLLSSKGTVLKKLTRQEIDKIETDKFEWKSLFRPSQY